MRELLFLQRGRIACNAERYICRGNSVRLSHAGTLSRRMKTGSFGLRYEIAKTLVFWYQQSWGRRPLPPKICAQIDPSPLKSADFDQYLLITSQLQELVKEVQLSRIGSRVHALQRAIDEVRTLLLSPGKGCSKSKFVIFVNKNQFKSNKLCY